MNRLLLAHLALATANIIYGVNYNIAKIAMPSLIGPFGFILIRVSLTCILFWLLAATFARERIEKKDLSRLAFCGLFGVAINQMLFFSGLANTTEINASLIMITTPILVLLLSHFIIGERITWRKVTGILLGTLGAAMLISFGGNFTFGSESWFGDLQILINALSYGVYLVLVKPLMVKYHPLTIIKYVFLFGLPYVLIFGWRQFAAIDWVTLPGEAWFSLVFVVFMTTFCAYLLNIFAMKQVNPSVVSIYMYGQPLVAALLAISLGTDRLTPFKFLSGLLIFTGLFLAGNLPAVIAKTRKKWKAR